MVVSNKISKFLVLIVLSIFFVSINANKVLADSKLSENRNRQIQFLEEKRKSQSIILGERQENTVVEGMMSSKDVENKQNAEIEKENQIKTEQKDEKDSFTEMVKAIRKLQSKKHESKELIHKEIIDETSETNNYYKNTNIPMIKSTVLKADRIELSQPVGSTSPGLQGNIGGNPLLGRLETMKDLVDEPVINGDPVDMAYSDIEMLERMVMAESGGEPYLGQIAVTNVILNRVKSNRYPSTLQGVLFQKSQFSPVKNGVIRGRTPNASVKKAVAEALNGRMVVPEDTLYFVNPVLATDQTVPRTKTPVKVIGCHTFYK